MGRGIKVWSTEVSEYTLLVLAKSSTDTLVQNGVCRKTIDRNTSIETITWFPTNDGKNLVTLSRLLELNPLQPSFRSKSQLPQNW